jgi:parallel beta-helix repeat protein
MSGRRLVQVGAAAVVLGVSLAGPQVAVAAADSTDTDAPSVSTRAEGSVRGPQSTGRQTRTRPARSADAEPVTVTDDRHVNVTANVDDDADEPAPPARRNRPRPAAATGTVSVKPATATLGRDDRPAPAAAAVRTARAESSTLPTTPAAALDAMRVIQTATAPAVAPAAPAATAAADPGCALCRAARSQSIGQTLATAVNHAFNSAFTLLAGGGPLSDLFTGALVLIRRSLFFIPEGVTASQTTTGLDVTVNTGSVAYFRQDGSGVQVSGDPRFWGAKTYSDTVVSVDGNAGGTGVVLTSGIVNADLSTDQIDSIRFQSGSAFTGEVTASAAGPITLRDAVRGLGGVVLNAPVVLASDVQVDAGEQDATFGGTVDAAKAGKQSLMVTALGTTTFAGDVGGSAALASLLTQGIAPVSIPQSSDTKTIPLHFLPWAQNPNTGKTQVKYGIDVAIGDNPSQVYEFDTGGNGFFAGYNPPFWTDVPLSSTPVSIVFTSGNNFQAVVATPTVTIGSGTQTVSTQPINIGAIMSGSSSDGPFDFTDPAAPPIEGGFFGDFGASLAVLPVSGSSTVLANPLLQLPGNLSNGYLVQLGPIGVTPQVTVGLTEELRAQFPYAVPIAPTGSGTYPVSGWPLLNLFGITPTYYAQLGDTPRVPIGPGTLPTVVDSGAPTLAIRLNGAEGPYETPDGQLQPGVTFIAEFPTAEGKDALTWTLVAGDNPSVDQINYGDSSAAFADDNLNTGLNLYNFYDVIFDVQDQVLRLRPTGGQATVVAQSVTTTGSQTYRQNAELGGRYVTDGADFSVAGVTSLRGDTVIDAGGGDVTFSGTVDTAVPPGTMPIDAARSLTVTSSGATTFTQTVGGLNPLESLTTDAGGSTRTFQVTTFTDQSYDDDIVTLKGQYFTYTGDISVTGDATLAAGVTVQTQSEGGAISFGGRIDAESGRGYPLALYTKGGPVALAGAVGSTYPLGGLTVDNLAATGTMQFTSNATIAMDGSLGFANSDGLVIEDGVAADLPSGGVIRDFAGDGIQVNTGGSRLSGFVVSGNTHNGIHLDGATDVELSGNVIYSNGNDGILSSDSDSIQISGNTIGNNGSNGVAVQKSGTGNAILSNSIFANGANSQADGLGIALSGGGNAGQAAPTDVVATVANSFLIVAGKLDTGGVPGDYRFQVFFSPAADTPYIQGRKFLGEQIISVTDREFALPLALQTPLPAGFITVTATPDTGPPNTSEFSKAAAIAGG